MISVITPVLNEEKTLEELYRRTEKSLGDKKWEIIYVNDGSTDNSRKIIEDLVEKYPNVKLKNLAGNNGKSQALMAGFSLAKGEIVVTIDSDLQCQPEEIPKLLAKLNQGYDLVSGWKRKRSDPWLNVSFSRLFNSILRLLTKVNLHDVNCGFKAYRKEVIDHLDLYGNLYRFIPILAAKKGFRVTETEITHNPRRFGKSKYKFTKFFFGFFDLLTVLFLLNYKNRPFTFFGTIGSLALGLGTFICSYLTLLWLQGQSIGRRPLLILGILLIIVGIQLFTFGFLAELIISRKDDTPKIQKE